MKKNIELLHQRNQDLIIASNALASIHQVAEELILNSVEALSRQIIIRLDLSSFNIQIEDDGVGISSEDLADKVVEWFHSSKATTKVNQGRALASIKTLAEVFTISSSIKSSIITKTKEFREGILHQTYDTPKDISTTSSGTIITIKNLFYSLPVRQNNLKMEVEYSLIREFIQKMSILHHSITWHLMDSKSNKLTYQITSQASVTQRLLSLYGLPVVSQLVQVQVSLSEHTSFHSTLLPSPQYHQNTHNYKLTGLISQPLHTSCHWNKDQQALYINHRWLRNKDPLTTLLNKVYIKLLTAIQQLGGMTTKHSSLFSKEEMKKYPIFILHCSLPEDEYDLLLENDKSWIVFRHVELVEQLVYLLLEKLVVYNPALQEVMNYYRYQNNNGYNSSSKMAAASSSPTVEETPTKPTLRDNMMMKNVPADIHGSFFDEAFINTNTTPQPSIFSQQQKPVSLSQSQQMKLSQTSNKSFQSSSQVIAARMKNSNDLLRRQNKQMKKKKRTLDLLMEEEDDDEEDDSDEEDDVMDEEEGNYHTINRGRQEGRRKRKREICDIRVSVEKTTDCNNHAPAAAAVTSSYLPSFTSTFDDFFVDQPSLLVGGAATSHHNDDNNAYHQIDDRASSINSSAKAQRCFQQLLQEDDLFRDLRQFHVTPVVPVSNQTIVTTAAPVQSSMQEMRQYQQNQQHNMEEEEEAVVTDITPPPPPPLQLHPSLTALLSLSQPPQTQQPTLACGRQEETRRAAPEIVHSADLSRGYVRHVLEPVVTTTAEPLPASDSSHHSSSASTDEVEPQNKLLAMLDRFASLGYSHHHNSEKITISKEMIAKMQCIGQVDQKFVTAYIDYYHDDHRNKSKSIADVGDNKKKKRVLCLLDQHAVDERIQYEELLAVTNGGDRQQLKPLLLQLPQSMEVDENTAFILQEKRTLLESWCFDYTVTHNQSSEQEQERHNNPLWTLNVTGVPMIIDQEVLYAEDLLEFVHQIIMSQREVPDPLQRPPAIHRILTSKACRSAIKFGQTLPLITCRELLDQLRETDMPFQCAHGRPSIVPIAEISQLLLFHQQQRTEENNAYNHDSSSTVQPNYTNLQHEVQRMRQLKHQDEEQEDEREGVVENAVIIADDHNINHAAVTAYADGVKDDDDDDLFEEWW